METASKNVLQRNIGDLVLHALGGEEHVPRFMDYLNNLLEETKGMTLKETADYAERMAGIGRYAT